MKIQASGHKFWQLVRPWACIRHGPSHVFKTLDTSQASMARCDSPRQHCRFTYLGSVINSCDCSTPEMFRCIGLDSGIMNQLTCVWQQSRLESEYHAVAIQCLVASLLLFGAETWTLIKCKEQKLEASQMSCLRHATWTALFDFVSNASVMNQTQQQSICSRIHNRHRLTMFGDVRRLYGSAPDSWRGSSSDSRRSCRTTDQHGDVRSVVRGKPGSVSWTSMSGSQLTLLVARPAIVKLGGHYDPLASHAVQRVSEL